MLPGRMALAWLYASDLVLRAFARTQAAIATRPQRVLLAVGGQLGDAVIATAALSPVFLP